MRQSSDVLLALVRRFWILVLCLVWGAVLGGLVSLLMTPTYQASVYLLVVTNNEEVENTAAYDYTQAYSKLPTVPMIVGPVVGEYGIEPTQQAIEEVVKVEVPLNTPVFKITIDFDSPNNATALANDLANAVETFVADRLSPGTGYRAVVVAEATTPQRPTSPDWRLNVALGASLGLLIGGAAALFWDDVARARKRRKFGD